MLIYKDLEQKYIPGGYVIQWYENNRDVAVIVEKNVKTVTKGILVGKGENGEDKKRLAGGELWLWDSARKMYELLKW